MKGSEGVNDLKSCPPWVQKYWAITLTPEGYLFGDWYDEKRDLQIFMLTPADQDRVTYKELETCAFVSLIETPEGLIEYKVY